MFRPGSIIKSFKSKKGREVIFRYPQAQDLDTLLEFANELSQGTDHILLSGKGEILKEKEKEYLDNMLGKINEGNEVTLFAFIDGMLVGNCSVTNRGRKREHVGRIGIAIKESFRNEGIGEELLKIIFEEAWKMGLKLLDLKVYGSNTIAQALYKKLGFEVIGKGQGTIKHNNEFIDEIWMLKKLE